MAVRLFKIYNQRRGTNYGAAYNTEGEKIRLSQIVATFKDPKTYLFGLCQGASVLGISVVGSFLPTFIVNLGFTACMF